MSHNLPSLYCVLRAPVQTVLARGMLTLMLIRLCSCRFCTYAGVLAFEKGLLWPKVPALYWLTPVMSFSILVGLGLDYDIFLLRSVSLSGVL